ncbi:isovaleryl-CoA dehydrogenase [Variovorax paradoxus]|uniref:acyl-CoA dehydrogenase family protein n=1 Tax=Variovorax paradoxus TaxID=34073 RepID=UPI002791F978|nr:acyl-CoA dehydrogenase family protein [Variovorax paradoxus]MDQ0572526.1 isovaleryl-CoA dehydrogenase [Variovorax paradoxus]
MTAAADADSRWALLRVPLPPAAQAIRQEAHGFANREIAPRADEIESTGTLPADLWPKLGDAGLLGVTVPSRFGGAGLGYLEHLVVMEEISRASAAVGLSYLVHSHACTNQIALYGSDEQKARLLPALVNGSRIGGLAITEPEAGSDAIGGMATMATRRGNGFTLSGRKAWIANAPCADVLVVYARTGGGAQGKGLTAFALEFPRQGASLGRAHGTMGLRGCPVGDVVFDDCHASAEDVIGEVDGGVAVMMDGLERERFVASGGALGLLQRCMDAALAHSLERRQFGQPIADFQLVQSKLADMVARTNATRSYAYTAGAAGDFARGGACDGTALLMFAAEQAAAAAGDVLQLMGAAGFADSSIAARLYRDSRFFTVGFGTSEIRRVVIGRSLAQRARQRSESRDPVVR